jgi:AAA15 family ATPase/GTPase
VITDLAIHEFRGFRDLAFSHLPRVNLIGGVNNAGKTALLEALFFGLERNGERLNSMPRLFRPGSGVNDDRYFWKWLARDGEARETTISVTMQGFAPYVVSWRSQSPSFAVQGSILCLHAKRQLVAPDLNQEESSRWPRVEVFVPVPTSPIEDAQVYIRAAKKAPEGEEKIESLLREIEPRLKRIRAFPDEQSNQPLIHVGLTKGEALPANQLGQGFNRLLRIYSSVLCAEAKIFLLDEVETGLHHTALPIFWKGLAALARQEDVQIFATTHSRETIFDAHRIFLEEPTYDFAYHRLERTNDHIKAVTYDKGKLSGADKRNFEVR